MPARHAIIAAATVATAGRDRIEVEVWITGPPGCPVDGPCGNVQISRPHARFVIFTG